MVFHREHHSKRRHSTKRFEESSEAQARVPQEHTGSENAYMRSLIDSRAKVTVVMTSGERFQGRIRYYDRHCFSIGLSSEGPKLFLRKSSVSYISEE
jgi:sRNA-binding regulator protein Hfq